MRAEGAPAEKPKLIDPVALRLGRRPAHPRDNVVEDHHPRRAEAHDERRQEVARADAAQVRQCEAEVELRHQQRQRMQLVVARRLVPLELRVPVVRQEPDIAGAVGTESRCKLCR